jgi:hypothetical protein
MLVNADYCVDLASNSKDDRYDNIAQEGLQMVYCFHRSGNWLQLMNMSCFENTLIFIMYKMFVKVHVPPYVFMA